MSITVSDPRVVRPVARPSRRRATPARRRYVHSAPSAHQPSSMGAYADSCVEERRSDQSISWQATVAGVVGTAVVILALVGLANLRAGQLEPASQPPSQSVEHVVPSATGE
ncbi:hypothetical protein HQ346_05355 [Rhodococcus sp. BP-252]|nr:MULTISPECIES: hypothetical protein [Rhodococcus]MBY6410979.1 hypothetical protein [Rhodococcus sp. BP-320]MBY6415638.1 hypothetical protein [Rhodococcus sp. BP-321]MBY6420980.1 hypothetical protein [Rhodococcus sp. BP-324]MBY6426035.1 hypothetical protein [Rhodococcus sp. BP-323]MBY6430844.1 hypothetical protein [Rhodococcus sp. BP-322]